MALHEDLKAIVPVTAWVAASTTYARFASSVFKPGKLRLLSLLPAIALLPCLPWYFTTMNLRTNSAFFLAWLGVFKLLLLAFGTGPLSPSLPLTTFIAISSLPLKLKTDNNNKSVASNRTSRYYIKLVLLPLTAAAIYHFKSRIHLWALLAVYSLYIYLVLDLILAIVALLARSLLGLGLEPQFDAPYKSASLQDFWGRRWNLMVTSILRPSVYYPVRSRYGAAAGVMAVFVVSGIMHEVVFWYMTLERPTGEVALFFLIHGLCTMAEVKAKKAGRWRPLPPAVAVPMTLGFVAATAFWLFFPPMLRAGIDVKGMEEGKEMVRLVEDVGRAVLRRLSRG